MIPVEPGFGESLIPGWFVGLFVVFFVVGVGITVWKVSESRRMAREAGMDEDRAAAVTLLSEDGFEANYLASALRSGNAATPDPDEPDAATRLATIEELRRQGLITEEEYSERRAAIIESI